MKSYIVYSVLFFFILSFSSCKQDDNSSHQNIVNEKVEASKMTEEKKMGKGSKKGQLPPKTFRINGNTINGVQPGMRIAELQHLLVRGKIKTGDGIMEVQRIRDDKGGPMGYLVSRIGNSDLVGEITLTSKKVLTPDGIRIGDTYAQLKESVEDLEIHGSEIEGRVYASNKSLAYRLDIVNFDNELDASTIPSDVKITHIIIKDLK